MFLTRIVRRTLPQLGNLAECQRVRLGSTQAQEAPHRVEKTLNQVTLLGRVGGDPQKRGSEERPVVIFSIATHSNYQYGSGDLLQKVDWHRVCVFKPYLRETVYRYLTKGQRVLVQGKISYSEYKDETGIVQNATSIIADDVTFLNNKGGGGSDADSS